jgi:D,D-heptose 1,7-bisphosphate phosphatase
VFLDRDGVLIEDTGYPSDPDTISLLPGVGAGLRRLREAGWRLVVVSNQSGVARGKFGLERLEQIHDRLLELLRAEGVELDALYFCPHHPNGIPPFNVACDHRKPESGMLRSAARELGLRLEQCWMIGEKESDVEAAHGAGVRAIRLGEGTTQADAAALDLEAAAAIVLVLVSGAKWAPSGASYRSADPSSTGRG